MAWKDKLLDASFKGVKFEVMDVTRAGSRAIVSNEYPYTAGADLDDLNLRARRFRIKAIVYGDNYEADLQRLINALEAPGVGELVHPVHGAVQCLAENWDDEHQADLVDGAAVSISFIEHTKREVVFSASSASKADAIVAKSSAARAAANDALVRGIEKAQGGSALRLAVLKDTFNQAKSALRKLLDTTALRAVLSDLDPVLFPRAYVADLLTVVERALQGLPFGGRNMLFDRNAATSAGSGAGASLLPASSQVGVTRSGAGLVASGLSDFNAAATQLDPAAVSLQLRTAVVPDAVMRSDMAAIQAHARVHAACAVADCAAIVLAGEMENALLERADIEALTNKTRTALQVAIDAARAGLDAEARGQVGTELRAVAYAVQDAALAVINQRPPLVRRTSPVSGPVRLVAHHLYGDASKAEEISRLNGLGRDVFIKRGDALNVYAA